MRVRVASLFLLLLTLSAISLAKTTDPHCLDPLADAAYPPTVLHEGKSYSIVRDIPDPAVPGEKLFLLQDHGTEPGKRVAPFEEGQVKRLLARFPESMKTIGIEKRPDGLMTMPDVPGLSHRMPLAFSKNGVRCYRDTSADGATKLDMARRWANKEVPISENGHDDKGRSLKLHDVFVHALSYAMIPKELVDLSTHNMKVLLEIYDNALFKDDVALRRAVLDAIEQQIGTDLELGTANLSGLLLEGEPFNIESTLILLSGPRGGLVKNAARDMNLAPEKRRELDRLLGTLRKLPDGREEALSIELARVAKTWR